MSLLIGLGLVVAHGLVGWWPARRWGGAIARDRLGHVGLATGRPAIANLWLGDQLGWGISPRKP